MADTSNLTNYLKDVAAAIKKKKGTTEPILAANFDIEIETINVGGSTVENGDVKLFASVEEMNNYVGANSGDLAIVYSVEAVSVTSGTKFSNLYFPKTMSIPKRTLTQPTVTATGDADITVAFTSTSVTFSIKYPKCPYTFTVLYELSEGTTYVRNDTYSDSPFNAAELNEYGFIWSNELFIFPASVSVTFTMPTLASNAVKAAFRYGELIFGGMYQYKNSKWIIADNQFSAKENDVISGKTAYGPYGLITGTRPVVAMELVEDVKYEPMTNYVGVTIDRDIAINAGGILAMEGAVVADGVGLTGDKIVAGNTILGVKGTAEAGGGSSTKYAPRCLSFKDYAGTELDYETANVDTVNLTDMSYLFSTCQGITSLDLSSWDVSNVTTMANMFEHSNKLESIDMSGWDVSSLTNTKNMFYNCSMLKSLDLSNFHNAKLTAMNSMFHQCLSMTSLNVNNLNTTNVADMGSVFYNCASLSTVDLSSWDTTNVTSMSGMFSNCSGLTSLDLSNFKTSNVTNMSSVFRACTKLQSLNLSGWDTTNVTNMGTMFWKCSALQELDISSFDFTNVTSYSNIFLNVPADCLIYVKDQTAYDWVLAQRSDFTNVQIKNTVNDDPIE